MKRKFLLCAFFFICFLHGASAGDDSGWGYDSISEGYSETYSEAGEWTYDGGYDSNDDDDYNHRSYYSHADESKSGSKKDEDTTKKVLYGGIFGLMWMSIVAGIEYCKMKHAEKLERQRQEKITGIAAKVTQIDLETAVVNRDQNKDYTEPIFFTGQLSFKNTKNCDASDKYFNVTTHEYPMLQRYVEVYCWKENITTRTERRGKQSRTVTDYTYTTTWLSTSEF